MVMKLLLLLFSCTLLLAENQDALNLLKDLDTASQISTKTRLNCNKTPAVVSVLHADELQKLGITNVYEALETVPGIEISMGLGGAKQINMRGNKSIVTDKLKFMVDGITINSELSGSNHFYLNIPIESIERIEVIRGPASALYGSFAHIGVINVITKGATHKKGNIFFRASSEDSKTGGFTQHVNTDDFKIALQGSYEKNDKSRSYDNYSLLPGFGPFTSYEDFSSLSLGANIAIKDTLFFTTKYLKHTTQNYYGYGVWPIIGEPMELEHKSFVNELSYAPQLTESLKTNLKLGYKSYSFGGESRLQPLTITGYPPYGIPPCDLIGGGEYTERSYYSDLSLNYTSSMHNVTFGTYLSRIKVNNPVNGMNDPFDSEEVTKLFPEGGLKNNIERDQYAFYLSDIITFSNEWMANIGGRYDNYNDSDDAFSPKLSLLYMPNEEQSYKLMYQNSFRVPTFVERYGTYIPFIGSANLESETIDTYEFAYSYQSALEQWLRINFFYSQMQNFIYRDANYTFQNGPDSTSYGAEFEFKTPLYTKGLLQANYSYVINEDSSGNNLPMMANHLANIMFSYQFSCNWHSGTKMRYVSTREREVLDDRDPLKAYVTLDQTLSFTHKEYTIQASVKNIFDEKVYFPAPLGNPTTGPGTYEDDMLRDGRTFWLSFTWKFE